MTHDSHHARRAVRRAGFTLIELLVTISIIAMLISLLLPALSQAREASRSVACLSNMRQMGIAAAVYTDTYRGSYPLAQWYDEATFIFHRWDITSDYSSFPASYEPGMLWQGQSTMAIQQCPSYTGAGDVPYTGYNYNTSYIGRGKGEGIVPPARVVDVKNPGLCIVFGDGSEGPWGANNFMRSPLPSPSEKLDPISNDMRWAGTQNFRHTGQTTNALFADGHGQAMRECFTPSTFAPSPGTGFLGLDNSFYDLE